MENTVWIIKGQENSQLPDKKIAWRIPGLFKADAEKVAAEIESLGESYSPEDVVKKAEDKTTELHKCFEWDESKAAYKYRIEQARMISRNLIYYEPRKPEPSPIRVFYKAESGTGYQPTKLIVRHENHYQELLKRALAELRAFKRRYACICELKELMELIDTL